MLLGIPEVTPLVPEKTEIKSPRLNLLVPSLEKRHVFGGISTAIKVFCRLAVRYPEARIIVTDSSSMDIDDAVLMLLAPLAKRGLNLRRSVVVMGDRYGKKLPVARQDVFLATAWWTAYILEPILAWQRRVYSLVPFFYYLIQDYEPGFYAWSSRYAMAESTYKSEFSTIAIINSKSLSDFFNSQGYSFARRFCFEPPLNETLMEGAETAARKKREKPYKIVIYGRPGVQRNCFELCLEALRVFVSRYEALAGSWEFFSVGEDHHHVELGRNKKLRSLGKLSLVEYRQLLMTASVGVSLMVSPHPSYPPVEMAAYGMVVITNRFANKDLGRQYENIISVDKLTADNVAEEIYNACQRVESRSGNPCAASMKKNCCQTWENVLAGLEQLTM